MERKVFSTEVALTDTLGTTQVIDKRTFVGGTIFLPTGSSSTSLAFYGAATEDGEFVALYDNTPSAATLTVSDGNGYEMPDCIATVPFIKIVSDASETLPISLAD